ncbi:SigE family RNA polymerase sigma factor [Micromonospora sp. NBC_01412]|uniref:SigE family RNA polymerase sigma factor n=1 Tax=Micromonospora sp. NBC_01412 TaxID=2903590 RepID=UPI00324A94C5
MNDLAVSEFELFARRLRGWLRREAYHICGDWHEADDLVQMALWKMHRQWPSLAKGAGLGAYARRIVVRDFLTERRHSRWRREVLMLAPADAGPSFEQSDGTEDRAVLVQALRRLGPRQRAVLTLRFLADLSVQQTARRLGCTPGTVTSQTVRALAALRQDLAQQS